MLAKVNGFTLMWESLTGACIISASLPDLNSLEEFTLNYRR
jgi:hypothetical protein